MTSNVLPSSMYRSLSLPTLSNLNGNRRPKIRFWRKSRMCSNIAICTLGIGAAPVGSTACGPPAPPGPGSVSCASVGQSAARHGSAPQ